jgi:hypothetical protein
MKQFGDFSEFKALTDYYGVHCLVDSEQRNIRGFKSLVDGRGYTLGPPQQLQQEPSRKRPAGEMDLDAAVSKLPSAASFAHGRWAETKDDRFVYHRPRPNPSVVPNRMYPGPQASFTVILSGRNIGVCGAITTKASAVQEWLAPLMPLTFRPCPREP